MLTRIHITFNEQTQELVVFLIYPGGQGTPRARPREPMGRAGQHGAHPRALDGRPRAARRLPVFA